MKVNLAARVYYTLCFALYVREVLCENVLHP